MNCFGMDSREAGHSLVPAPPHMTTGMIFDGMKCPEEPHLEGFTSSFQRAMRTPEQGDEPADRPSLKVRNR